MPYPMVHFAIASELCLCMPTPSFLIGSIAPDAIHVRENVTRKDKGITHFVYEDKFPSIEVLKGKCLYYLSLLDDVDWKNYILGYFAHIYADIRWTETVFMNFEQEYQGEKDDIRKTYNKESNQVEFDLMREEWTDDVLKKLHIAAAYTIEPLLTQIEVNQYRDIKLQWLRDRGNEPQIIPVYLREDVIENFVSKTTSELNDLYREWGVAVSIELTTLASNDSTIGRR
ncbi:zinc dependent phospholipase C family protein [Paenibacillus mucilaginosus]|uniref:Phospholipase C/D domain-containing protein n=1 Tax=Paenibacillus mucilaginosus (strain KNP414) TaxID=1036673 RepID=F8FF26_PAEMK|nr:zinc dependent phospholipase C family protein [Paenibacillus mucilaginosus]AEI39726.1 hypothetical protein KNP414_01159 [Paenibacillus mucilaginosus KNP414]